MVVAPQHHQAPWVVVARVSGRGRGNVLLAGCAGRSEMSVLHPVQDAHTSFVLKLNKKPFSNFLLSNFVFLYFFATLEAFALAASRSLRASRVGQSTQAVRDFIIPQFLFTYSSMYVPLK